MCPTVFGVIFLNFVNFASVMGFNFNKKNLKVLGGIFDLNDNLYNSVHTTIFLYYITFVTTFFIGESFCICILFEDA